MRRTQQAFTLIELLTTLAIMAFLLLVALPNLSTFIDRHRLESNVELLLLSIKGAKVSAIKHNSHIIICRKSQQLTRCVGNSNTGKKDWSDGWLIFDDKNFDWQYQANERLINEINLTRSSCLIIWNRGDYLSFRQFGLIQGGRAGSFMFSCNEQHTQLIINWVGRVRRQT